MLILADIHNFTLDKKGHIGDNCLYALSQDSTNFPHSAIQFLLYFRFLYNLSIQNVGILYVVFIQYIPTASLCR